MIIMNNKKILPSWALTTPRPGRRKSKTSKIGIEMTCIFRDEWWLVVVVDDLIAELKLKSPKPKTAYIVADNCIFIWVDMAYFCK